MKKKLYLRQLRQYRILVPHLNKLKMKLYILKVLLSIFIAHYHDQITAKFMAIENKHDLEKCSCLCCINE